MLKLENDKLKRNVELEVSSPVVHPEEKRKRDAGISKLLVKRETRVGLDEHEHRERQPIVYEKDRDTASHISENSQIERTEIEWLENRLITLERLLQEREQSKDQYSEKSYRVDELERKEAHLKNLEKELNGKEEEIRNTLKLERPREEIKQTESELKKEETALKSGFTPYYKPYVNRFSGVDPVPKSESSFEK